MELNRCLAIAFSMESVDQMPTKLLSKWRRQVACGKLAKHMVRCDQMFNSVRSTFDSILKMMKIAVQFTYSSYILTSSNSFD